MVQSRLRLQHSPGCGRAATVATQKLVVAANVPRGRRPAPSAGRDAAKWSALWQCPVQESLTGQAVSDGAGRERRGSRRRPRPAALEGGCRASANGWCQVSAARRF